MNQLIEDAKSMSINDNIGLGTGPVLFGDGGGSNRPYISDERMSKVTIELDASELLRFQFSSVQKKFVLEIDKIALEKQLTLQGYK